MAFKWLYKTSKPKLMSVQSLLKDCNVLVLEPLTSNLEIDWKQITKNSLTFFKYLLEHFKPASNSYLKLNEQTLISSYALSNKINTQNQLFTIKIKTSDIDASLYQKADYLYGWTDFVLLNEDFNKDDYDNALNNLVNAYLQDNSKIKPITQEFSIKTNALFFSRISFLNKNQNIFKDTFSNNVLDGYSKKAININYNGNEYYSNISDSWTINDVFSNKQILTNQDFNYEYNVSYKESKLSENSINDVLLQEPISNEHKLLKEELGLDMTSLGNDFNDNEWYKALNNIFNESSLNKFPSKFFDTALKIKAIKIIARTIFNNILLNANKNVSQEVLLFFKELKPQIKIDIDITKNSADEFNTGHISFKYTLTTNLNDYLFNNTNIHKTMNIYDTFYTELKLWNVDIRAFVLICYFNKQLSSFESISPVMSKNIGKDDDFYNKFTQLINSDSYKLPNNINDYLWERQGTEYTTDGFLLLLRQLYDDFTKNLINHYDLIKQLNTKYLKDNLDIIKNNDIEGVNLQSQDYFYYRNFDDESNKYCIENENKDRNKGYNILLYLKPFFFSSLNHTLPHLDKDEHVIKYNDIMFYLKYKDGAVLPFSFNDLITMNLDTKKMQLQSDIKQKAKNNTFMQAMKGLNEALAQQDDKTQQNDTQNKNKVRR